MWSTDFQQGRQDNSVGKEQSCQQMVLRQLDRYTQKNEVGVLPYTTQKMNSKWIRDRIVRDDMIKLLEENRGINLQDLR